MTVVHDSFEYGFFQTFIERTKKYVRVMAEQPDFKCQVAIDQTRVTVTFDAQNDYGEFVLKKLFDQHAEEEIKKG